MQDYFSQETASTSLITMETYFGTTHALRRSHHSMSLQTKYAINEYAFLKKKIKLFCRYFIKTNIFFDNNAPFESEYSQLKIQLNVRLLNLNLFNYYLLLTAKINYYLLKPYPTLGRPFKKFSSERLRATTRNTNLI